MDSQDTTNQDPTKSSKLLTENTEMCSKCGELDYKNLLLAHQIEKLERQLNVLEQDNMLAAVKKKLKALLAEIEGVQE